MTFRMLQCMKGILVGQLALEQLRDRKRFDTLPQGKKLQLRGTASYLRSKYYLLYPINLI